MRRHNWGGRETSKIVEDERPRHYEGRLMWEFGFACGILAILPWATSLIAAADGAPAGLPQRDRRFILGISADGSMTLDGKPVEPRDLRADSARIVQWVRSEERDAGRSEDPKDGPPAFIMVWAADDVPC